MCVKFFFKSIFFIGLLISMACGNSQSGKASIDMKVGGPCEGCEAALEYGDHVLNNVDTLPLFNQGKIKLKISGIIYRKDGKTPASGVIAYMYQTNEEGIYQTNGDEEGWAKRHGFIRGWVKTDLSGAYTFYTFRPGSYPQRNVPQHIHITIKEPDLIPYYIDDFMFEDDPLLTTSLKDDTSNRAGSGISTIKSGKDINFIKRDIILGLNIPNYPNKRR